MYIRNIQQQKNLLFSVALNRKYIKCIEHLCCNKCAIFFNLNCAFIYFPESYKLFSPHLHFDSDGVVGEVAGQSLPGLWLLLIISSYIQARFARFVFDEYFCIEDYT